MRRRGKLTIGGAGAALIIGAGSAVGVAATGGSSEAAVTGATRERAVAAALEHVGGGIVTEATTGDDGPAYDVEVRRRDGSQVEVRLDRQFGIAGSERDDDGPGDADGSGDDEGRGGTATAVSALPRGREAVRLNPADFTTRIDNPYWPMTPGTRWVYRETAPRAAEQRVVVTVTSTTKRIADGVEARVVRDVVTERGQPVEVTDDWYAQDRAGNVWYLGERTAEYENGKVTSTAGSFEAGVDGAQPGIAMPAAPRVGMGYRQEYHAGQAEDRAEVLSLHEQVEVPFGHFAQVLMTRDLNPLKPRALEYKLYAPGTGPVLSIGVSGGSDREELVAFRRGS